jgi:hypothetical protein
MSTPTPQRYAPTRSFPPYAFLPGRDPHPTGDPRGHSYAVEGAPPPRHLPAERWHENEDYLYGCDLYNHGYLWEAHEAWETQWHAAKHDVDQADVLQGLIQCAAACLKIPMEQPRGLEKLAAAGTGRLERVARERGGRYMGLDLAAFVQAFRAFVAHAPDDVDDRPRLELG